MERSERHHHFQLNNTHLFTHQRKTFRTRQTRHIPAENCAHVFDNPKSMLGHISNSTLGARRHCHRCRRRRRFCVSLVNPLSVTHSPPVLLSSSPVAPASAIRDTHPNRKKRNGTTRHCTRKSNPVPPTMRRCAIVVCGRCAVNLNCTACSHV